MLSAKLDYLRQTKVEIKNAIINKGVNVSDSDTFRSYADKIADISGGDGKCYYMDFEFTDNSPADNCSSKGMPMSYATINNEIYTTNNSNTGTLGYLYSDVLRKQNFCIELKVKVSSWNNPNYAVNYFDIFNDWYERLIFRVNTSGGFDVAVYCGSSSQTAITAIPTGITTLDEWFVIKVKFIQKPTRCYEVYINDTLYATTNCDYEFPRFNAIYINGGGDWDNNRRGILNFKYIRMYFES